MAVTSDGSPRLINDTGPSAHASWRRFLHRRASPDTQRLQAEIETFRAEIHTREAAIPGSWAGEAGALLARAETLVGDGEAWTCYLAAVRRGVDGLTPAGVWAERQAVLAEAKEKLSGWRRDTVIGLLDRDAAGRSDQEHFATVAQAIAGDPSAGAAIAVALAADRGDAETTATIERALSERLIVRAAAAVSGGGAPPGSS